LLRINQSFCNTVNEKPVRKFRNGTYSTKTALKYTPTRTYMERNTADMKDV